MLDIPDIAFELADIGCQSMPFREKSAWASLTATIAVYGAYFAMLAPRLAANPHYPAGQSYAYSGLLFGSVITLIVVQIVLQSGIAIVTRDRINVPPDERERLIDLKSDRIAMGVLSTAVACLWLGYLFMPALLTGSAIPANLLLSTLVLAAVAKYASQIVYFHRAA